MPADAARDEEMVERAEAVFPNMDGLCRRVARFAASEVARATEALLARATAAEKRVAELDDALREYDKSGALDDDGGLMGRWDDDKQKAWKRLRRLLDDSPRPADAGKDASPRAEVGEAVLPRVLCRNEGGTVIRLREGNAVYGRDLGRGVFVNEGEDRSPISLTVLQDEPNESAPAGGATDARPVPNGEDVGSSPTRQAISASPSPALDAAKREFAERARVVGQHLLDAPLPEDDVKPWREFRAAYAALLSAERRGREGGA